MKKIINFLIWAFLSTVILVGSYHLAGEYFNHLVKTHVIKVNNMNVGTPAMVSILCLTLFVYMILNKNNSK